MVSACSNTDKPESVDTASPLGPNFSSGVADACMGDLVWNDLNMDGIQDAGEPGLPGVTVKIFECPSGTPFGETTTDANGYYSLFVPGGDDYYIEVVAPADYVFSPANQGGDDTLDSDVDPVTGLGFCTHLGDKEIEKDMDAGLYREEVGDKKSTIGDRVWFDDNCDGIQDAGEKGADGVKVTLQDCAGNDLAMMFTAGGGLYCFTDLEPGDYVVCFVRPLGYEWSPKDQGSDDAVDSDVDENGYTDCFNLKEDTVDKSRDAGLCEEKKEGGDGCTPGFWKTKFEIWGPTGYSHDDLFNDVFGCEVFAADFTLGDAIWQGGGHVKALGRHAVAALLNASHPLVDYDMSVGEIMDLVCDNHDGDANGAKNILAGLNELGCSIDAHGNPIGLDDDSNTLDKTFNK